MNDILIVKFIEELYSSIKYFDHLGTKLVLKKYDKLPLDKIINTKYNIRVIDGDLVDDRGLTAIEYCCFNMWYRHDIRNLDLKYSNILEILKLLKKNGAVYEKGCVYIDNYIETYFKSKYFKIRYEYENLYDDYEFNTKINSFHKNCFEIIFSKDIFKSMYEKFVLDRKIEAI